MGEEQNNPTTDASTFVEHLKKKLKHDKKQTKVEEKQDVDAPSTSQRNNQDSMKPMEKKKLKKALDKERHRAVDTVERTEPFVSESKRDDVERSSMSNGYSGSIFPEFHIGVFKDLGSADASVREVAAEKLVRELKEVQQVYDKLDNKELVDGPVKLEAEKDDGLNNCAPSLRYAVRRLIRGVSSSRECARQGFALGLTILVSEVPQISLASLLKLIVDSLETSSSMKGQEIKDCLLGQLFAYAALARSGRLNGELNLDQNIECIKEFASAIISLAIKKRYLQEPAVAVLLEFIEKLPVELLDQVIEIPGVRDWFEGATEIGNPDALLLALKIRERIGHDHGAFGKLLPPVYSANLLFASDHLSSIANCLKESSFCQPRVHNVWHALIDILLRDMVTQNVDSGSGLYMTKKHKKSHRGSLVEEDVKKNLNCFCEVIIEGALLTSSHDRKHLAFDVLLLLLPKLPISCIPVVISYKLTQCLVDILSTKDSWLYKIAQYFVKELSEWVKNDDARRVAVIMALEKHTNGKFDTITKSKTVKNMMAEFKTESGCMLLIQTLMNMFLDEGLASEEPSDQSQTTDDNSEIGSVEDKDSNGTTGPSENLKKWVIDSLPCVLKHSTLEADARLRVQKEILKFLSVQGIFSSSLGTEVTSFELEEKFRWPKSVISVALCKTCIQQLELLLANAQKLEGVHALGSGLDSLDLGSYFMRFLSTLCNIPSVSLFRVLNDEDQEAFMQLQATEALLAREERNSGLSSDANRLRALRYMLIQLLLQILLQPGEFGEAASELVCCCKRACGNVDLLSSSVDNEIDVDGSPEMMDVLVDTMLALLPQSPAPLRSSIEQVFKYFCCDISEEALTRMLRVIKKDLKPARHHDVGNEDEDEEEDDLLEIEEAEESDEAETGETVGSDVQSDDSGEEGSLQVAREEPEGQDSDEAMDEDESMFAADAKLVEIFKLRQKQAGGESAQSQLVLFKLRVLSLLEIYLHENPGNAHALKVFSNLVQAFVRPPATEGSEQLGQRIWGILQKKIFKAKEYPLGDDVDISLLESLLEKSLKLAGRPFKKKNASTKKQSAAWTRHKMITSLAQDSTYWILKVIDARKYPIAELQRVLDIFKSILVSYFDSKKSHLKTEFLREVFRRRPWIGHHLLGFLLEKCGSTKAQFRQVEALDLIHEVLKSLATNNTDEAGHNSRKILKSHLPQLRQLVTQLALNMPDKQARRADVRKFCNKVFHILTSCKMASSFLKDLEPDAHAALESQFHDTFLALGKKENKV